MTFLVNKNARGRASASSEPNFLHQIFWGIVKLVVIAFCGVIIWYVTRLEFFTITDVAVTGGETISHEEIKVRLEDELKGTYFLIIPKRFSYLFPHDRMMDVLEKNSRMYNITIERTSRTALAASFEEYIPHALWCAGSDATSPCYFLTSTGFAFAEAPVLTGGTLMRHEEEGLIEITEGQMINSETLTAIDTFVERAEKELGFRISSLVHTKNNDIRFMINGGGMIFTAKGKDYSETFDNVKSVLASKEFTHIKPGNFNYIDARFGNKIFVNEEFAPEVQATSTDMTNATST